MTAPRRAGLLLVLAGLAHLLAPRALLWLARTGYDRVLRVRFRPDEGAPRRVRWVGAGMVTAGLVLVVTGGD